MRVNFRIKNRQGDTIIEVLLAMSILTLVLFTSWGLVNRSTQLSLAARQRVVMVNQMKEQAEILKAKFAVAGGAEKIRDDLKLVAKPRPASILKYSDTSFCIDDPSVLDSRDRFYFNDLASPIGDTKQVNGDNYSRVWVEYTTSGNYTDFYIRSCWLTSGGQQKTDNSQFIVRLNE